MKNKVSTIIFAIILIVVGPNAYADGTKGKKKDKKDRSATERIMDRVDNEMSLENWMMEITEFVSTDRFEEAEMNIESWMLAGEQFTNEALVFENWMTEVFTLEESITENELELEDWMMTTFESNDKFQEEELTFEAWMFEIK